MGRCRLCGRESRLVSGWLGVCAGCLRERPREAREVAWRARRSWRRALGLPVEPPSGPGGVPCRICVNECRIREGGLGYCGVWRNRGGRLEPVEGHGVLVGFTYLDPLPTNCVSTPVCPAATSRGYPRYTDVPGPERGFYNLAVFMGGCPLDCAFCQNPEHKTMLVARPGFGRRLLTVEELVEKALDPRVRCICYFGGDPTPQAPQLVAASRRILEEARRRGQAFKRICWETDGLANPGIMRAMARVSLESGGIVKVDWKAWTPSIYEALTGARGEKAVKRLMENTRIVAGLAGERPEPPLLVVSTLLVPGYVGPGEVYRIASYLATLDPVPPLVLLAFHPDHLMPDLPPTSRDHVERAVEAARRAGLREVYVGNEWLVGDAYRVEGWWDPG